MHRHLVCSVTVTRAADLAAPAVESLHRHLVCSVTVTGRSVRRSLATAPLASSFGLFGHCYGCGNCGSLVGVSSCIVIWFVRSLLRTQHSSLHISAIACIVIWFVRSLLLAIGKIPCVDSCPCIVIWFVRSLLPKYLCLPRTVLHQLASSFGLFGHCYVGSRIRSHCDRWLASSFGLFGHCYQKVGDADSGIERVLASSFGLFGHCYLLARANNRIGHQVLHRHLVCSVTVTLRRTRIAQKHRRACIVIWFVRSLLLWIASP